MIRNFILLDIRKPEIIRLSSQLISEKLQLEVGIEIKLTDLVYSTMDVGFIEYPAGYSIRPGIKYYYTN